MLNALNMQECKSVGTPGVKDSNQDRGDPLEPARATQYRSLVARANQCHQVELSYGQFAADFVCFYLYVVHLAPLRPDRVTAGKIPNDTFVFE